jgi:hypothetical protein
MCDIVVTAVFVFELDETLGPNVGLKLLSFKPFDTLMTDLSFFSKGFPIDSNESNASPIV